MGYYTIHTLAVSDDNIDDHVSAIEDKSGYSGLFEGQEVKWYEHEIQMRDYSSENQGVLFMLGGEGEQSGDLWFEYYKDGKMQRCKGKVSYDEFDESKLC